jgi:hypothetical protein
VLSTKFRFIWPSGYRENKLRNRPIRNKNCLWRPCFLMDRNQMCSLYRGPLVDASYLVSFHLTKRLQRRNCFRNRLIRNNNCLWWACLLTDRDEMCNLYRGPSISAFYQVSFYLAKWLQRKQIEKSTNQKQELSVAAMFFNGSERNVQSL